MEKEYLLLEKKVSKQIFKRETADKALKNVLEKIEDANKNKEFIYFVKKAVLFGSYINSNKEKIGDLDIALYLELKNKLIPEEEQNYYSYKKNSKKYEPFIVQLIYGKEELFRFIKDRKKIVDLHDGNMAESEAQYYKDPYCYIYGKKNKIIYEMEVSNNAR